MAHRQKRSLASDATTRIAERGFSGIEFTVVIILLGIALVLTLRGAAAIPAIRSYVLMQQIQNYQIAIRQYEADYRMLPGDDTAAPQRWRRQDALYQLDGAIVSYAGDGKIEGELDDIANTLGEQFLAWSDLRKGGYIGGDPTLVGQSARPENTFGGSYAFAEDEFGLQQVLCLTKVPGRDAELLDRRLDDGKPSTGQVRATSKWDPAIVHNHFTQPDVAPYDPKKTYIICLPYLP